MVRAPKQTEYRARIHRVVDYIEQNIAGELTLEELAKVAHFSPYHFHRIFSSVQGETFNQFIGRLRIESAARKLLVEPETPITTIAADYGYASPSTFARAFKAHFGEAASTWRAGALKNRKDCKVPSNTEQNFSNQRAAAAEVELYLDERTEQPAWRVQMDSLETKVDIENLPEQTVAYARAVGNYKKDPAIFGELWGTLMRWAAPRGFMGAKSLCVFHDNPDLTEGDKLRISACVVVPKDTKVEGEIGKMVLPAGKYAKAHFDIGREQYSAAWDLVFGSWLPESGYAPDDRPCFEVYSHQSNDAHKHPITIYVPVRPL